jgi:hypothetical protein
MARWPLDLLFVELAAFYFFAGISKLRDAGPAWMDGYTLQWLSRRLSSTGRRSHRADEGLPGRAR